MELNSENVKNICRTCLQQNDRSESMFSIKNDSNEADIRIFTMISSCTKLIINCDDGLPDHICDSCLNKLSIAYEFKQQSEHVDKILKNFQIATVHTVVHTNEPLMKKEPVYDEDVECMDMVVYCDEKSNENVLSNSNNDTDENSHLTDENIHRETLIVIPISKTADGNVAIDVDYFEKFKDKDKDNPNKVIQCPHSFNNEQDLENNDQIYKSDGKNICQFCQKQFCNRKYLQIHIKKQHCLPEIIIPTNDPDNPYQCQECKKNYSTLGDIQIHVMTHTLTSISKVKCIVCDKIFSGKMRLQKHLLNKHTVRTDIDVLKPFKCDICEKAYTTFANLTLHKAVHIGFKPYECDICKKGFYKRTALDSHKAIHTGLRSHLCSVCGRSFTSANILQQHKKTHLNIRPHICGVCKRAFHTSNDLRVHFRTHSGEKPYLCSSCGRGFSRVTHLNIHLRTHTGERPYGCPTCGKAFAQSGDLKSHIRTHTGEKPYCCKICNKRFNQSSGLTSHIKSHTGERNHNCDVCNKNFTQSSSLARHMKTHTVKA